MEKYKELLNCKTYEEIVLMLHNSHSLRALQFLLYYGREVDLIYKDHVFGIYTYKTEEGNGYIFSFTHYGIEKRYKSIDRLFSDVKIEGEELADIWDEIEVKYLF